MPECEQFARRRFLVGGASDGLGFAIASRIVAAGGSTTVFARNASKLSASAAQLGPAARAVVADIGVQADIERLVDAVHRDGPLDGIVVNAGGPPPGTLLGLNRADWDSAFALLITGPLQLVGGLRDVLTENASVVVIASSSVKQLIPGLDASNVLRPAVAAMVKCLARELAPLVRVNAIAPGRINTARVATLDAARARSAGISPREQVQRTEATIPLGRYGNPDEVADAAVFLLSSSASYVNATTVVVDGGLVTASP